MQSDWKKKHLLGLENLTRQEIEIIFNTAQSFKEISVRQVKKTPALRGKTVINLFLENSTRTRTSFELAAKRLSADVLNFSSSLSSVIKGESVVDTIKNLTAYHPDIFVIRTPESVSLPLLSQHTTASLINAGDGMHEHPTQGLLDMFTVYETKKALDNLTVLIVGDILHSRVARSNIFGFSKFNAKLRICGPTTLLPYLAQESLEAEVYDDFDQAIVGADVIIMLRMQRERQNTIFFPSLRDYVQRFSLNKERLKKAKKDCLVLHPGPVNWDVEIASNLKETLHPLILNQAENGLAIRMAVLYLVGTLGGSK